MNAPSQAKKSVLLVKIGSKMTLDCTKKKKWQCKYSKCRELIHVIKQQTIGRCTTLRQTYG